MKMNSLTLWSVLCIVFLTTACRENKENISATGFHG
jgi:hypothetical protein